MTKDLVYILANALAGGIGGYYTNDYAVKMIFRKYWGMGGLIIDTRLQFIANMSQLVERDVLNVHTLAPALKNEQCKPVLTNLLADFWQNMQTKAQDTTLGEVEGLGASTEHLVDFYKTYSQGALRDILGVLLHDIKLKDVVKEEQCSFFAGSLYSFAVSELAKRDAISNTVLDYQKHCAQRPITDFLPIEFFEQLANNLADSLEALPKYIKAVDVESHLDDVIEQTYADLSCDTILDEFESSLKEKTLFELLGHEHVQGISREFLNSILAGLQTAEGRQLFDSLAQVVFSELKQLDVSLYSLLNDGMRKKLDTYLRDTLPWFMQRLLNWLEHNKPELELVINRAVDQVLADDDDLLGLKNEAKKLLKDVFVGDIAVKYELVGKIVNYIKDGVDTSVAANELSEYIIGQLKNRKVGELLSQMEDLGLVQSSDGGKMLLELLCQHLPKLDLHGLDCIFERKAGEFINISLHSYFAQYFKQALKEHLRDEFICAPQSAEYIRLEIKDKLCSLAGQKLNYFADAGTAQSLGAQIQQAIIGYLQDNAAEFTDNLQKSMQVDLEQRRLDWAVNDDMQQKLKDYLAQQSVAKLQLLLADYKSKTMVDIYNSLSSKLGAKQLASFLGMMLTGNLDDFLHGKVEKAVADNLQSMSNEELQTLTENFMGQELQPISRLGAGMGAGIGAMAAAAGLGTVSPNMALNIAASSFMFAGIGWLTNVVAIQMIFRPYQPKQVLGWRIPLTPGVIPQQKPRFAAAMGEFIDQKLFVQERAVTEFLGKQEQAQESLLGLAYSDDYAWLYKLLHMQQTQLTHNAWDFIQNNIASSQESISVVLQDEFSRLPLGVLDHSWLNNGLSARSGALFGYGERFLQNKLHAILHSQTAMGEILPEALKLALRRGVDNMLAAELTVLLEALQDEEGFNNLLVKYSDNFDSFVQQPIGQMLSTESTMQLKSTMHRFVLDKLHSKDSSQIFYDWLNERLETELQSERQLGEVFDGALLRLIQASSSQILTTLVARALDKLGSERERIKQEFYARFMDSAGFLLKAADMILDIEDTIYRTIDRMIDVELKKFTTCKNAELQDIIEDFVNNKLSSVRVGDLGFAINYRQIIELVNKMLQSTHMANALNSLLEEILSVLLKLNIKQLLHIENFNSLHNIYRRLWPEIRVLRYQLANNIHSCHDVLVKRAGSLVETVFMNSIYSTPMNKVLSGIKEEMLFAAGKRLLDELQHSQLFNDNLDAYVKGLEHELRFKSLDMLLDINLLSRDLLDCVAETMQRQHVRELLFNSIHDFLGLLIANSKEIIKDNTKNYFLKSAISSLVSSLGVHFESLLKALDIKTVAAQQIEAMSSEKLKLMFDSFAAPYFRRIELYGLIAGILALITVPLLALLK